MSIIQGIAGADLAIWGYLLLARGGFWRANCCDGAALQKYSHQDLLSDKSLRKSTSPPRGEDKKTAPAITIIVPARNEADMLESTLPSLIEHDYPGPLHVILVDDRSDDATAEVAARIAAQRNLSERLTIVRGRPLPAGWKGKVWAMQCGMEALAAMPSPPRYILFTDADIAYDKGALTRLVARAEANDCVLTSLMVRLRCESVAERGLIPAFVFFFQLLYPFAWVNQPACKTAAAAGGCMLVRADALEKAGGIAAIHAALIDDCALGRVMKRQGRVWLWLTRQVHSLRAYPRLRDIRAMVARSAYDQLGYSPLKLSAAMLGMLITYIAPVLLTLFAGGSAQLCGALCWLLMALSFVPILRFYGRSPLQGILLPVIAACYMGFTLDSAWQYWRGRGGLWKGRVQAAHAQPA